MAKDKNVILYELLVEDKASPLINNIDAAIKASSESVSKLGNNFDKAKRELLNLSSLAPSLKAIVKAIDSLDNVPSTSGRLAQLTKLKKELNDIRTLNNAINSEVGKELRGSSRSATNQTNVKAYTDAQNNTVSIRENLNKLDSVIHTWANLPAFMQHQALTDLKSIQYARGTEKSISTSDADLLRHAGFKALDKQFSNGIGLTVHDIEKLIVQSTSGRSPNEYKKYEKELASTFAPYFDKLDRRAALGKPEYVYKADTTQDRTRKERSDIAIAVELAKSLVDAKRVVNREMPSGTPITQAQTWSPITITKQIAVTETEVYKKFTAATTKALANMPTNLVDVAAKWVADRFLSKVTEYLVPPTKEQLRNAATVTETFDPKTSKTSKYLSPEDADYVKRLHAVGDILKHNTTEREKTVKIIDEQVKAEERLAKLRAPSTESLTRKALRDEASLRTGESGRAGFAENVANIDAGVREKELKKYQALMHLFREDVGQVVNYYTHLKALSKDAFSADYLRTLSNAFSSAASELTNYVSVSNLVITTAYETVHGFIGCSNY